MKKKVISYILAVSFSITAATPITVLAIDSRHSPFSDLSQLSWCYGYVTSMVGHGFLHGYNDNTFRQDNLITRAETASILGQLGLKAILPTKQYQDVSSFSWYHAPIEKAYTSGAMLGTNHDTTGDYFAPNDFLTRSDAAILASRLYGFDRRSSNVNLGQFNDVDEMTIDARPHIQNVVQAGIMTGYPDGYFRPNQPVTRGEFSRIFNFICHKTSNEMQNNLEDALRDAGILTDENHLEKVKIRFDIPKTLDYGIASTTRVRMTTEHIPDGTVIPLFLSNNSGGITVPNSVIVFHNTATFDIHSSATTALQTYVLTAEYEGQRFASDIQLNHQDLQSHDAIINKIIAEGSLEHGRKDSIDVIIDTKDIPQGEYLTASIDGAGLYLVNEEERVRNDKAVFTIKTDGNTPTGNYTFKVNYKGHYRTANIVVAEEKAKEPHILNVLINGDLKAEKNDNITITIHTNDIPNGKSIKASVTGLTNGNIINPADVGINVAEQAVVYENQAVFTVYSSSDTPEGRYMLVFDLDGLIKKVPIYVAETE